MQVTARAEPAAPSVVSPRPNLRLFLAIGLTALMAWPGWEVGRYVLAGNVHEVIPGSLYRGGQPSARSLETIIQRHNIRTVLNVRGCCWPDVWYTDEVGVCERLNVNLEDVSFSAIHLPSRDELRVLIDVLDRAERPIFVHCRHGADRTGIASMAAFLLMEDKPYSVARQQLGIRYGHLSYGKTGVLDRFMDLYARWLAETGKDHTPAHFRHWVLEEYQGGWCDAQFESVERLFETPRVGQTMQYRVVVRNTSRTPWQFRPIKTAGYHVTFKVLDRQQQIVHEGRAGMLDRKIHPGEKIDVVMIVPPLTAKGRYRLIVDMIEEGHCWFHQTGSIPWEEELLIRE